MKHDREDVLMVPYIKVLCFFARSAYRGSQDKTKRGPFFKKKPLLSDRKTAVINKMHSNSVKAYGKKCCYFLDPSEVKFLTHFGHLFKHVRLNHLALMLDVNHWPNCKAILAYGLMSVPCVCLTLTFWLIFAYKFWNLLCNDD